MFGGYRGDIMGSSKRYAFFILFCLVLPLLQTPLASAKPNSNPKEFSIFQENGLVFEETLSLNGSSNYPLANSNWFLIDLTVEPMEVLASGVLSNVMAVGEAKWDWSLDLNITTYNCTCGFLISEDSSNHPHFIQRGTTDDSLIVYIGLTNHQPYILPFRTIDRDLKTALYMITNEDLVLNVPLILPIHSSNDSFIHLEVCSAAHLFCLDEMIVFEDYSSVQVGRELSLVFEREHLNLSDGYWMYSITIVDALLRSSNTEYFMILIDQNVPDVTLTCDLVGTSVQNSSVETVSSMITVEEHSPISFSASVSDGYSGRDNILSWTLMLPDGSRRALLPDEQVSDTLVSLQPDLAGVWVLDLLVRDSAGWLVHSSIEFEVLNLAPVLQLELDSFGVTEGSVVTLIDGETWEINGSKSFDTGNDDSDLLYTWYVNGNAYITGTTTLNSSDFSEPGTYNLRLIVEDNDGATSEVTFDVLISEAAASDSSNAQTLFISVSVLIVLVAAVGFFRSSRRHANQTTVPKWIVSDSPNDFDGPNDS